MTKSMLCSTMRNVVPCSLSCRIRSAIVVISVGFTPPAGSSSSTIAGSAIST